MTLYFDLFLKTLTMTNCFGSILILCVKVQAYDYTTGSFQRNHYYIIIYNMNYIVIKFKKVSLLLGYCRLVQKSLMAETQIEIYLNTGIKHWI